METEVLQIVTPDEVDVGQRTPLDEAIVSDARRIVMAVRSGGDESLRDYAIEFDGLEPDDPLVLDEAALADAFHALPSRQQEALVSTHERIRKFSQAQFDCLDDLELDVRGGQAGHTIKAVEIAGCYAPGGGYPLPSSVLMTATPANVAGVSTVIVASPNPDPVTLAAAHACDVDLVITAGGAQAMGAFAFGTESIPRCDVVVGPGGPWVTAGKKAITGYVRTDFMAGPTELVILADGSADPALLAADLIAQAEHAPEALPVLVTPDADVIRATDEHLLEQLNGLPTAEVARQALERGYAVKVPTLEVGVDVCNELAPEHLQLAVDDAQALVDVIDRYGTLFVGQRSAEALGDYGIGPNHVLPTGGAARFTGGLSVLDFLRLPTWVAVDDTVPSEFVRDASALARMEGLEGHARSIERRREE